jgi:hypothetical protein
MCLVALAVWGAEAALRPGSFAAASGVRLIMVQEPDCRFCRQWEADIGPRYARSAEGRFAPLERVRRNAPAISGLAPVVYTPTFIVLRGGEEIGRITGYPGPEYFWEELDPILAVAGYSPGL